MQLFVAYYVNLCYNKNIGILYLNIIKGREDRMYEKKVYRDLSSYGVPNPESYFCSSRRSEEVFVAKEITVVFPSDNFDANLRRQLRKFAYQFTSYVTLNDVKLSNVSESRKEEEKLWVTLHILPQRLEMFVKCLFN